jgi:hypothetical protein
MARSEPPSPATPRPSPRPRPRPRRPRGGPPAARARPTTCRPRYPWCALHPHPPRRARLRFGAASAQQPGHARLRFGAASAQQPGHARLRFGAASAQQPCWARQVSSPSVSAVSDGASLPVSPIRTYEPGWERPWLSPMQPTDIYHPGSGRSTFGESHFQIVGVDMGSLGALERGEAGARRHTPPHGGRAAPGLEARAQSPRGGGDRAAEQSARFTLDSPPPVRAASGQASRWLGEAADGRHASPTRASDETCPVSTEGRTRRVQLVREGGGGAADGGAGAQGRDLWGNGEALRGSGGKAVFVRGRRGAGHS